MKKMYQGIGEVEDKDRQHDNISAKVELYLLSFLYV